jgi:membrane protease YdiL (CAAX protease family)
MIVYLAALALQVFIWFAFYGIVGYSDVTMSIACGLTLVLGVVAAVWLHLHPVRIGLGGDQLLQAVIVAAAVHLLLVLGGLVANALGGDIRVFRQSYSVAALANNWILTAFGEELVFAGVIFTVLTQARTRRRWVMVPAVALLFALWHFPGYLAIGLKTDSLSARVLGDLAINMVSWLLFGAIYVLSGNLWLVAIAHASTDYALLPMITQDPLIGLVFMLLILIAGWLVNRTKQPTRGRFRRIMRSR